MTPAEIEDYNAHVGRLCSRLTASALPLLQMLAGMEASMTSRAGDLIQARHLVEQGLAFALKAAALQLEPLAQKEARP